MSCRVLPLYCVQKLGYYNMQPGKSIVLYCRYCRSQQVHKCIGKKTDGQATLYKFECETCKMKIEGIL